MVTFTTEQWDAIKLENHSRSGKRTGSGVSDPDDRERMPLDPDWDEMTKPSPISGMLHITTVRAKGELVGYAFAVVERGMHYRTVRCSVTSTLYFISPEVRGQLWLGVGLFREVEQKSMLARGVKKMTNRRKLWLDTGPIFRRCGWKEDDEVGSSKWIGP